ncbi:hypothetical protein LBMAG57_38390 [Verrucomicrobiota bacterium]|nr:hypothetical protein LBMAG57_38390 [Verrucomicrobiota bacterium]
MEDLKIDILMKFLLRDGVEQAICSLHIFVRGLPDSRLITTQTEIAGDCQTFTKTKGSAVVPVNKEHFAGF